MKKELKELCDTIYKELDIDIETCIKDHEPTDFDELIEALDEDGYFNVEIIYYHNAMEYLRENDPSLTTSLELAHDMGYEAKDLNSEVLASILASDIARNDIYEYQNDLEELLCN